MHIAINNYDIKTIAKLSKKGTPLTTDEHGHTITHLAAEIGDSDTLRKFFNHGVVSKKDHDGHMTIHLAAQAGQLESIKTLESLGVDIHELDDDRWDILDHAIVSKTTNDIDVVKYLVEEKKFDVAAINRDVAMKACTNDDINKYLIDKQKQHSHNTTDNSRVMLSQYNNTAIDPRRSIPTDPLRQKGQSDAKMLTPRPQKK